MKEIRYGGGVRTCKKCGELINDSIIHKCKKEEEYYEEQKEDDIKPNGVFPCEEDPVIGDY